MGAGMDMGMGQPDGFNLTRGVFDNRVDGATQAKKRKLRQLGKKEQLASKSKGEMSELTQSQLNHWGDPIGFDISDALGGMGDSMEKAWYEDKERAHKYKQEKIQVDMDQDNNMGRALGGAIIGGIGTRFAVDAMRFQRSDRIRMFRGDKVNPDSVQPDSEYVKANEKEDLGENISKLNDMFNEVRQEFAAQSANAQLSDKIKAPEAMRKGVQLQKQPSTQKEAGMSL